MEQLIMGLDIYIHEAQTSLGAVFYAKRYPTIIFTVFLVSFLSSQALAETVE